MAACNTLQASSHKKHHILALINYAPLFTMQRNGGILMLQVLLVVILLLMVVINGKRLRILVLF